MEERAQEADNTSVSMRGCPALTQYDADEHCNDALEPGDEERRGYGHLWTAQQQLVQVDHGNGHNPVGRNHACHVREVGFILICV